MKRCKKYTYLGTLTENKYYIAEIKIRIKKARNDFAEGSVQQRSGVNTGCVKSTYMCTAYYIMISRRGY